MLEARQLYSTILDRKEKPVDGSRTTKFLDRGPLYVCGKVIEETAEVVNAFRDETSERLSQELGDLIYFIEVAMVQNDIPFEALEASFNEGIGIKTTSDETLLDGLKVSAVGFAVSMLESHDFEIEERLREMVLGIREIMYRKEITARQLGQVLINS